MGKEGRLSNRVIVVVAVFVASVVLGSAQTGPIVLENARVIPGDGTPVIERAAIVVDGGRILSVDTVERSKALRAARRVDLSGKTVMPALIDGHVHLGFQVGLSFSAVNYSRETLIDQLNRYAFAGVAAVLSMGTDAGATPMEVRADQAAGRIGGARFLFAGRGIAAPDAGPASPEMKPAAYGVASEPDARRIVANLVAQRVNVIKIWVDDRNHSVQKLSPPLYRAIIDEAHKRGAKVVAHVFYLDDAKELARAGVDAFAHLVRDAEVDEELVALLLRRRVLVMPNMSISENGVFARAPEWLDDPLLHDVAPQEWIARVRASFAGRSPEAIARARQTLATMRRSLAKMNNAGVTIGFGTDDGAVRDHFYAFTAHRELRNMAASGMTTMQVITAATQTMAEFLGLADLGAVKAGKSADLIVLDANPLDDLANTTRIADVYRRGERLDRGAMRASFK